jgi:hypothetical protein
MPPQALYQLIRVQQIAFFTDYATPIRETWAKAVQRHWTLGQRARPRPVRSPYLDTTGGS